VTFSSALSSANYAIEITVTAVPTNSGIDFRPCYNITSKTASGFTFQPKDCRDGNLDWMNHTTTFDWLAILYN